MESLLHKEAPIENFTKPCAPHIEINQRKDRKKLFEIGGI